VGGSVSGRAANAKIEDEDEDEDEDGGRFWPVRESWGLIGDGGDFVLPVIGL